MTGFFVLLALLFLPLVLYLVLGVGTFFKRFYIDAIDRVAKSYFRLSFLLPIAWGILLVVAYEVFDSGLNITQCIPEASSFIERYINVQTLIPIGFVVFLSIPFLYGVVGLYWAYKATSDTKRIYRRGAAVAVVGAIAALMPILVSASLATARNKGADAAVKGNLAGIRTQLELYFDEHDDRYPTVSGVTRNERWNNMWRKVSMNNQDIPNAPCYSATGDDYFQYDYRSSADGTSWVADAPLRYPQEKDGVRQDFWCVDYTGRSVSISKAQIKQFSCQ